MLAQLSRRVARSPFLSLLPFVLFLVAAFRVFAITADDPYITFRYAANVLAGHGPVFNIGEHVEGYSSPLHLLLAILLLKLFPAVDPLFKAKIASLGFGLLTLYLLQGFGRRAGLHRSETVLAQCLVALNVNFALAAVNGLETTLYGSIVLATASLFLKECRRKAGIVSAFCAALMLLARPDALLLFAGLFCVRVLWMRKRRLPLSFVAGWAAVFIGLTAVFFLIRFRYYGAFLPNTYYAKQIPLNVALGMGAKYLLRGLSASPGLVGSKVNKAYLLGCIGLFWLLTLLGFANSRRRLGGWLGAAFLLADGVFILRSGGDWMLGWRFVVPILPVLAVLQTYGVRAIARWFSQRKGQSGAKGVSITQTHGRRPVVQIAVIILWGLALSLAPHLSWSEVGYTTEGRRLLAAHGGAIEPQPLGRNQVFLGDYIRAHVPLGGKVVYSEMGYAGFINQDKRFLDVRGLTDFTIARLKFKTRTREGIYDPDWYRPQSPLYPLLVRFQPDMIVSFAPAGQNTVLERYQYQGHMANADIYILPQDVNSDKKGTFQ